MNDLDPQARARVGIGGAIAGLLATLLLLMAGQSLRQPLFDLYQRVTPAPPTAANVQVVLIVRRAWRRSVAGRGRAMRWRA